MALAAILDIDGTLVDTNYQHAIAWYRAFREHGVVLPLWRVHRSIGMGGDQLVPALAGDEWAEEHDEEVRDSEKKHYMELIQEVEPLPAARDLIVWLKERDYSVVLASSAKEEEIDHYLDLLEARDLAHAWTSSADVEETKPQPDLVHAALDKVEDSDGAVLLGDSTFDCEAAERAGVKSIAVLTGGFSDEELREAGAVGVFESTDEVLDRIDETPFASESAG